MTARPSHVDLYATLPHFLAHAGPVFAALPDNMRGRAWLPAKLHSQARAMGFTPTLGTPRRAFTTIVASAKDEQACKGPVVLADHGAGQSYPHAPKWIAENPSYAGGKGHDRVVMFVCPNETVADRWRGRYPLTPAVAVGDPSLDRFHRELQADAPNRCTSVAFSFHWNYEHGIPELRSALAHYRPGLPAVVAELRAAGVEVIGHGHPRAWPQLRKVWADVGVEPVRDFADVVDRASLLAIDNSSSLYEFASLDRPVVALNAPWFRRDVHHGLRFWGDIPGPQCDEPDELAATILSALADPPEAREARREVVGRVYAYVDGKAAQRAADAIVAVL